MPAHTYTGELYTFSVGGSSQLEFLKDAQMRIEENQDEGAPASRFGGNTQGLKMKGSVTANLFSDTSTAIRLSHLGLTLGSLGAVNLLSPNILARLRFGIKMEHQNKAGIGELWEFPQVTDGKLSATLELDIDSGTAPSLIVDMCSSTYADRNKTLDFTLGGVQVQVPMRMQSYSSEVTKQGLQRYTMELADRSARAGVTVLPSGTGSLLAKAINDPKTALAFAFQGAETFNYSHEGNMCWDSYEIEIQDSGVVLAKMSWLLQGAQTISSVGAGE